MRHTRLAVDDPNNLSADMVPGVRTAATYVGTEQMSRLPSERRSGVGARRPTHTPLQTLMARRR